MRYEDDDFAGGLQQATRGSKPASGRRGGGGRGGQWGSLKERVSAAKGSPQAVFKISSYSRSGGAVWDRVNYVARDGEVEVEDENGGRLESLAELERVVEEWTEADKDRPEGSRLAMSAVVSFPAGVDQDKATEAARQFFQDAFAKNHDYVFAAHADAKQFHVHVVVQTRGHDEKQLRLNREDIQDLRVLLAEKARAQGIELDASPRWARGLEPEERLSPGGEGMSRRFTEAGQEVDLEKNRFTKGAEHPEQPARENAGDRAASKALAGERARRGREPDGDGGKAIEYGRAAAALAAQISQLEKPRDKVAAIKGAVQLATAGWKLTEQGLGKAADLAAARVVIDRVDTSINAQIRGLEKGWAQQAAITARRSLAAHLVEYRKAEREQAGQRGEQTGEGVEQGRAGQGRKPEAGGEKSPKDQPRPAEERDKDRDEKSRERQPEDRAVGGESRPKEQPRPAEERNKGRDEKSRAVRTEAEEPRPKDQPRPAEERDKGRDAKSRESRTEAGESRPKEQPRPTEERDKGRDAKSRENRTEAGESRPKEQPRPAEERDKGRDAKSRENRTEDGATAEETSPKEPTRPGEERDKGRDAKSRENRTEDGATAGEPSPKEQPRPAEERDKGRDAKSRENQALEYAAAAARLAVQVGDMESDEQKAGGAKDAATLAAFAWELAANARDRDGIVTRTREIVELTEGVIFSAIQSIADGPAKQEAVRADQKLAARLVEFRAEQGTKALAAERSRGEGVER